MREFIPEGFDSWYAFNRTTVMTAKDLAFFVSVLIIGMGCVFGSFWLASFLESVTV